MIKLYLSEYAKAKQIMENELQAKVDIIVEHLIKLILMPNNEAYKHWQGEIAGQLHTVHKLKGKNKYPTFDQLYEWTFNYAVEDITDIKRLDTQIRHIEIDYQISTKMNARLLSKELKRVCEEYFIWLCNRLSQDGNVSNTSIYRQLDSILKY